MMDSILKFLDFMPKNQKSLLVPAAIAFPFVYICLFICIDNFNDYAFFDRIMLTVAGVIVEMFSFYKIFAKSFNAVDEEYIANMIAKRSIAFNETPDIRKFTFDAFNVSCIIYIVSFSCGYFGFILFAIFMRHLGIINVRTDTIGFFVIPYAFYWALGMLFSPRIAKNHTYIDKHREKSKQTGKYE